MRTDPADKRYRLAVVLNSCSHEPCGANRPAFGQRARLRRIPGRSSDAEKRLPRVVHRGVLGRAAFGLRQRVIDHRVEFGAVDYLDERRTLGLVVTTQMVGVCWMPTLWPSA